MNIRPLCSDESFEVNGESFIFTDSMRAALQYSNSKVIWAESGWAFCMKNIYSPVCVVAGKPGHWFLYYYHESKGLLKERIAVPRAAQHRFWQIVEENTT